MCRGGVCKRNALLDRVWNVVDWSESLINNVTRCIIVEMYRSLWIIVFIIFKNYIVYI